MNGFKVEPKDDNEDEMSNIFLIKSLPLIKKANFTVDGMSFLFFNFIRFSRTSKYYKLKS